MLFYYLLLLYISQDSSQKQNQYDLYGQIDKLSIDRQVKIDTQANIKEYFLEGIDSQSLLNPFICNFQAKHPENLGVYFILSPKT